MPLKLENTFLLLSYTTRSDLDVRCSNFKIPLFIVSVLVNVLIKFKVCFYSVISDSVS